MLLSPTNDTCWGYPKIRIESPNTWERTGSRSSTVMTQEETKNLPRTAQTSKVMNPFTRALGPPFIGRRRDFYIPKTPSSSKNIPNVNAYMNVFFISYIYKLATSSHAKPGLFETMSLTLLLAGSWIFPFGKSSCAMTPELDLWRWKSVNLAMSLPSVLAWVLYLIHWY
jgi:hypothetical protein